MMIFLFYALILVVSKLLMLVDLSFKEDDLLSHLIQLRRKIWCIICKCSDAVGTHDNGNTRIRSLCLRPRPAPRLFIFTTVRLWRLLVEHVLTLLLDYGLVL